MLRISLVALGLAVSPLAAVALPSVGDVVGTNPDAAKAAIEKAGCKVSQFAPDGGKIEAKCVDTATNRPMDVYIDPATGAVTDIRPAN